ncbi:hypothetical protein [Deinococcus sp. JMULE3]|uniref:hypothetical protein n=1 Tax=Deinococcus sp. JMULE3 TaxID=2518341 RepID=UPI001576D821|nr:hypothetical protein [Deinococcus sp. JMULE3]NTX99243.1 hypothetical protein [Deinococcus sp. JMULE3]
MNATLIPADQLPSGAITGVLVDGVAVYRTRTAWIVDRAHAEAVLTRIFAELPVQDGERVRSGCLCAAGYSGLFTDRQAQALNARIRTLVGAARRATRPARDAKRQSRTERAELLVKTAFPDRCA